ncbi:MAG: VOC family protein [Steroidobacteraceae bacterium]|jgi:catechol 2,3-dioxygenase-like lactoylglutathione lyase family enzyme|nr:VOC family protein [Gemmatimonadaceae bacterium]
MNPPLVKRTTLIVRDLARSMAFYRDVLGMSVWYDDSIELSGVGLAAGKKGDMTRLVIMQAQDPVVGMIGLLEFTAPRMPEPARRERLGIGDIVFVMQGDDVEGVHRRAVEFGARIHALPHRFEVRGADGRQVAMTSLSLWDPDDYFIEFNQRHA